MSAQMVDWDLAVSLGSRLAGDGPAGHPPRSPTRWSRSCGTTPTGRPVWSASSPAWSPRSAPRRCSWWTGPAGSRRTPTASPPCSARSIDKLSEKKGAPTGLSLAVGSRVTGAEVGLLLGFLASKVLGQFDPFFEPAGRLLLVAPNIVHVERELGCDPTDFRLWVCLHEETHRVQFTAVPWMRDHLFAEIDAPSPRPWSRASSSTTASSGCPRRSAATAACSTSSGPPSRRRSWTGSPGSCPSSRATPTSSWTGSDPP